jgi:hypothetical protein
MGQVKGADLRRKGLARRGDPAENRGGYIPGKTTHTKGMIKKIMAASSVKTGAVFLEQTA